MTISEIPMTRVESNWVQSTTLDGIDFQLRLLWNERSTNWFMTLRDANGVDVVSGFKLASDYSWAVRLVGPDLPPGQIWIIDMTASGKQPALRDLGERVKVFYLDEEEFST